MPLLRDRPAHLSIGTKVFLITVLLLVLSGLFMAFVVCTREPVIYWSLLIVQGTEFRVRL